MAIKPALASTQPKSTASRPTSKLSKRQALLIAFIVVALGILLGQLMSSAEREQIVLSVVALIALLFISFSRPLVSILLWIFFVPFVETYIKIPLGAGVPDLSFSRLIVAFLGIALLAKGAIGQVRVSRIGPVEWCIVATTVGVMIAAPRSIPSPTAVIQWAISMHLTPLIVYFFVKNSVKNAADLRRVFFVIALLGAVSGVYTGYELATGNVLFVYPGTDLDALATMRTTLGVRMIRGIYGDTGTMGRVLALSIPITIYLLLESKGRILSKIALFAMLVTQFYGLVVAMSRTPWYALLVALFIMQFFYKKFRKVYLVILIVAAIGLWATWDQASNSAVARRVDDKVSTFEARQARWITGRAMALAKPIQGWGFGHFREEARHFQPARFDFELTHVENDYLYVLIGSGLIGFLPYMGALVLPLFYSIRLARKVRSPGWSGFITSELLAVYWAVAACYMIGLFTAMEQSAGLKTIAFAVAGAVVGTHEHLLKKPKTSEREHALADAAPVQAKLASESI
jgi:O-antigen ligase